MQPDPPIWSANIADHRRASFDATRIPRLVEAVVMGALVSADLIAWSAAAMHGSVLLVG